MIKKYYLYLIGILCALLLLPLLLLNSANAGIRQSNLQAPPAVYEPLESVIQSPAETTQIYLPITLRNSFDKYSLRSPFIISIAAIHQIDPDATFSGNPDFAASTLSEADIDSWYSDGFPSIVDALVETGATGTRVEMKWHQIQPDFPSPGEPPVYNWAWYDVRLAAIGSADLQIFATIELAHPIAAQDTCGPIFPERLDAFEQFMYDLVMRYKEPPYNIKFWEIDNEPDHVQTWAHIVGQGCFGYDGEKYVEALIRAHRAIKTADPRATVVMGGIAYDAFSVYPGGNFYRYFPDEVMEAGGGSYMDVTNIHFFTDFRLEWERWNHRPATCGDVEDPNDGGQIYYAGGIDIIAKANHFRNRMHVCHGVNKPLWLTETSAASQDDSEESFHRQARYVHQVYARALSVGIKNISWFAMTTPLEEFGQGLLDPEFRPKPSFFAYKAMTSNFMGFDYDRTLNISGLEGYYFKNKQGMETLVVWRDGENNTQLTLSPARQIRVIDYLNNTSFISDGGPGDEDGSQNSAIVINISDEPVYITITLR